MSSPAHSPATIIPARGLTDGISIAVTAVGRDDACFDTRAD
jgi:hypothetical protein